MMIFWALLLISLLAGMLAFYTRSICVGVLVVCLAAFVVNIFIEYSLLGFAGIITFVFSLVGAVFGKSSRATKEGGALYFDNYGSESGAEFPVIWIGFLLVILGGGVLLFFYFLASGGNPMTSLDEQALAK